MLRIGDKVNITSHEGFGGPAVIVEIRPVINGISSRFQVRLMVQQMQQTVDFWAWDFEIDELNERNPVRNKRGVYFAIRSLLSRNQ